MTSQSSYTKYFFVILLTMLLAACASTSEKLGQGKAELAAENYDQAYKTLLPLAQDGNADAQYAVGYMYYYGRGVVEDQAEARIWMQKAAAQGQPLAAQALQLIDESTPKPQSATTPPIMKTKSS